MSNHKEHKEHKERHAEHAERNAGHAASMPRHGTAGLRLAPRALGCARAVRQLTSK